MTRRAGRAWPISSPWDRRSPRRRRRRAVDTPRCAPWRRRTPRCCRASRGGRRRGSAMSPTSGAEAAESSADETTSLDDEHVDVGSSALTSGTSVLPHAIARRTGRPSMAVTSVVTVVLPSVPVTASIGRGRSGRVLPLVPRSISLRTGTPASRRRGITGWCSGTPGLGTTTSTAADQGRRSLVASGAITTSRPSVSSECHAHRVGGASSATTTSCHALPWRVGSRPRPATPVPYTRSAHQSTAAAPSATKSA